MITSRAAERTGAAGSLGTRGAGWRRRVVTAGVLVAMAGGGAVLGSGAIAQAASRQAPHAGNPVARYLSVNVAHKTATLTLLAGLKTANYGFDFNGYAKGAMTISVPTHWRVVVHCENKGNIPHSCVIVANAKASLPVFKGAGTPDGKKGIAAGHAATFAFTAGKPGHYILGCVVPGHIPTGMWDHFVVTAGGRPSISAR
ncbi:MAG TPA: sulfocyanin-like copper-binding protein [Verrucomicrobiae bacterium]|nr:sulfocyanin-like copper-binding protein [Verrucomicrobiae bacterium]